MSAAARVGPANGSRSLPPGPRLPALVQTVLYSRQPIGFLERCRDRYGPTFAPRFFPGFRPVYVSTPEAIEAAFRGDPGTFHAGEANSMLEPALGPRSVLLLDDEPHMRERKLMLPPFHGESVRRYGEVMARVAARDVARWPVGEPFSLRDRTQAITLEVILRAVFGIRQEERLAELRSLIPRLAATSDQVIWFPAIRRNLGPWSPWQRFRKVRAAIDAILYDEIRRRRAEGDTDRDDVASLLLQARHEDGSPMSDRELRDELMTLLGAGHETTATGLAWAFERLLRHPAALARLREELQAGDESYLDAVIKETLRVRPVVPDIGRVLKQPVEIAGYELAAGTLLVPSIVLAHFSPETYPEPHAFRPERFLDDRAPSYAWIPFGGGVRRCLGAAFATFEMKVVMRTILERAELRPARAGDERVRFRNVTTVPARGAEVVLHRRLPAREPAGEAIPAAA